MAPVVSIGGAGAGLEVGAKAGAAGHQARSLSAAEQQAFAAQLRANLAAGRKLPLGEAGRGKAEEPAIEEGDGAAAEKMTGKSAAPKKTSQAGNETTTPAGQSGSAVSTLATDLPVIAALPTATRIAHAASGIASSKGLGGRGREAKFPVAEDAPGATKLSAESASPASPAGVQGTMAAGSGPANAATSAGIAAGAAVGAVLAVPQVTAAEGVGMSKASESVHRPASSAGHAFHEDLEASATGASPGAGFSEARTLVTTPNVLEVGITGGAHGWLRVRAELEHTGEVTASLVASSAASADALHKELGAMSAYLKSEVVGVSSLAVTAMEKGGATQGSGTQGGAGQAATGSSTSAGSGDGTQRQSEQPDAKAFHWAALNEAASGIGAGYMGQGMPAALLGAGVGGWLNVRA